MQLIDKEIENLNKFIRDMIASGYKSFYDLDSEDQNKMIVLYAIENLDVYSEHLFNESKFQAFLKYLLHYVMFKDQEKIKLMTELMTDDLLNYFEKDVAELFSNECDSIYESKMIENGMVKAYHKDNGEVFWVQRY